MTSDAGRPTRERTYSAEGQDLRLFIVAGEHSGDALGAKLMAALNERRRGRVRYVGVGGAQMAEQGLVSQFPIEDVAVMGVGAILARLPKILTPRLRHRRRGGRRRARCARHHRQPRVHAPDRQARAPAPPRDPHHRLRVAERVGLAARPGAQDARLRGPRAGAAAVRAGRASAPRRAALHLRRPSADRAPAVDRRARHRAAGPAPGAAAGYARCSWCCRAAGRRRSAA